ncbi:undecaprenyl-diphosphate phosphatase [Paracidobacterium acidisoli]|uniref:Undecaprenyl-diphosphatase n=1 Tax=Paracidobacterium acidisoli TaxID=2303751 RepID=A0A372IQ44_9BACT|nr:undecaprenyl-diphosphate phosphatase [Paracidobacterium acidisoli]MBT9331438.1 undecaprenyl-diphosphate phosphatase [Paracidobacterium acidisoli]
MNDYIISVLLGIVEGLTEFLPVSSTAHLRISEALLHINLTDPYWKMYTIVIQLGAILALLLLFAGRIIEFFRTFPKGEDGEHTFWNHPLTLTIVAFLFTAVPSLLLTKTIGKHLESLRVMAWALVIGGIVMWVVDAWSIRRDPQTKDVEEMSLMQAIWVGICQVTSAVFPGTSRSMSTIAAGQMVGMTRPAALEFSFLVSIPTMIAATGYDLVKTLHPGHHATAAPYGPEAASTSIAPLVMTGHEWIVLGIGFVVSFVVALGVVEWFLQWVRKHGFVIFAVYRLIIGALLLAFGAKLAGM